MERKLNSEMKMTSIDKQDNLDELSKMDRKKLKETLDSAVSNLERLSNIASGNRCQKHKNIPYCPIELLHDCVAIVKYNGTTEGGLTLPDNCDITQPGEKLNALKGVVVGVGPGRYPDNYLEMKRVIYSHEQDIPPMEEKYVARFPMTTCPSDIVYFPDLIGIEVVIGGVTYYIVHEGDILARLKASV